LNSINSCNNSGDHIVILKLQTTAIVLLIQHKSHPTMHITATCPTLKMTAFPT